MQSQAFERDTMVVERGGVVIREWTPDDVPEVHALLGSRPVEGWPNNWQPFKEAYWYVAVVDEKIEGLCICHLFEDCLFIDQIEGRYEDGHITSGARKALDAFTDTIHDRSDEIGFPVIGLVVKGNERHLHALENRGYYWFAYMVKRDPGTPRRTPRKKEGN